jgi:hypothetical protein
LTVDFYAKTFTSDGASHVLAAAHLSDRTWRNIKRAFREETPINAREQIARIIAREGFLRFEQLVYFYIRQKLQDPGPWTVLAKAYCHEPSGEIIQDAYERADRILKILGVEL